MGKQRRDVRSEDQWRVDSLYLSLKEWEAQFPKWGGEERESKWPEIGAFKGRLGEGEEVVKEVIDTLLCIERKLEKLFTYAHLRQDEDLRAEEPKKALMRITSLHYEFAKETSWIQPELLQLDEERLQKYLESPLLLPYKIYLQRIVRLKPHTLSQKEEALLALSGNALEVSRRAFGAFNDADLKFPEVEDSQGKKRELTHATYHRLLRSKDRKLRKEAFCAMHESYRQWENTLSELIFGQVQNHLFQMKARKFSSCLQAALFPHQIETKVYTSLIETVRNHLSSLYRYMQLRKRVMGVEELHLYDLHAPLISLQEEEISYGQAVQYVKDAVVPLGQEYQKELSFGFQEGGWVDRYENEGKRSGAYSSGCYDSMPFILMNYEGALRDVMTLAHEAGHSMHTLLSNRHQPYHYSHYPIFLAEVASTLPEELLLDHLLARAESKERRAYLINQRIDDMRATFFRQVMFAEFEWKLHSCAEEGTPLTPGLLKREYKKLNEDYFGPGVFIDPLIEIEWARIPHFYYNFYVYQYATGISAAYALFEKIKKEGQAARNRYLRLLSSGCYEFPLRLLQEAGVEMLKPEPVLSFIRHFDSLVQELDVLLA
ncbi:MAG: oligoendopeptidase F [Chlamydiae bacterium RIFCSPLOWO2_02_FULL_49_12]|nr:MAG: oligoendopeptidase F [Chlamydiae bacterium RIFCSPLOWO2_02_FULL_49_12]